MAERVVLITGGARGIGREIGLTLAARHWSVAVCYRTSVQAAEETAAAMAERGAPRTKAVQCDVSEPEAAEGFIRTAEADWGRIDALINCAGPYHRVNLLDETPEGWLSMFANNLHPVISAQPQITAHFIAKSGILVLTRSLARLLAPYGITVNAISPGFIASGSAPPEELQSMVKNIPAGHLGSTQDAAGVTSFLLSEEARYVTGANIHVSGGWGL
jgi:3-oxoacyl-[acyl-carrier protein] reductase